MAVQFNLNLEGIRSSSSPLVLNPVGNVSILLKQRLQKLLRKADGQLIILQDYTTVPERRFPLIQIPTHAVTFPFYCSLQYLLSAFHALGFHRRLLYFLHEHVGKMSIYLSAGGLRGFYLFADVEVVQIEVVEEDVQIERLMREEASRIMVEKLELRQRSFSDVNKVKLGDNNCAICLDDLGGGDERKRATRLTMLPCSHIFHRSCICRWLKEQKSCPMCRRGIQPEDLAPCF